MGVYRRSLGCAVGMVVILMCGSVHAAYPTGRAYVTLITPYNGIAKYAGVPQSYVNEIARSQWGIPTTGGSIVSRAVLGKVTTSLAVADKAVALVVGPAKLGILARVAIEAGMMAGSAALVQWLGERADGWYLGEDGKTVMKPGSVVGGTQVINPGAPGVGPMSYQAGGYTYAVYGIYENQNEAGTACSNAYTWSSMNNLIPGWNSGWAGYVVGPGANGNPGVHTGPLDYAYCVWTETYQSYLSPNQQTGEPVAVDWSDVQTAVATDAAADDPNAVGVGQSALAAVAPSVNEANKGFPDTTGPQYGGETGLTTGQGEAVQDALDDSITTGQDEGLDGGNPEPSGDDWEYTPAQMAAAQKVADRELDQERVADFKGVWQNEITPETNPEIPEKKNLTEKLDAYQDGVSGAVGDIKSTLESAATVEMMTPTCSMAVDLGEWGNVSFSFCEWESEIAALGNVILMMASFGWLCWLFVGRGDA